MHKFEKTHSITLFHKFIQQFINGGFSNLGSLLSTKFLKPQKRLYVIPSKWAWLPCDLRNKVLNHWWIVEWHGRPQNHKKCKIVERDNKSTTEGGRIIQLLAINCGTMQVLKWILVEVKHLKWLLKKLNELMLRQKTMNLKQPLKTLTSTTKFGYVPNGRKKKYQDCRCRYASE